VRNFLAGVFLGVLGTYWYLTQGERVRAIVEDLWAQASSPPATSQPAARKVW
jgi:hypothetical protein